MENIRLQLSQFSPIQLPIKKRLCLQISVFTALCLFSKRDIISIIDGATMQLPTVYLSTDGHVSAMHAATMRMSNMSTSSGLLLLSATTPGGMYLPSTI